MAIIVVEDQNCLAAWQAGANILMQSKNKEIFNLITVISDPCQFDQTWLEHSPHLFNKNGDKITNVINTIFPFKLWRRFPIRSDLYAAYLARHNRAKAMRDVRWGTYFQRLIASPPDGTNQLERAIIKLGSWKQRATTAFVFHLSIPGVDAPRIMGGPCWQFAELLWNDDNSLDMTVVYRNHDFYNKVLGNFLGLGQLLNFIAHETGKQPGRLVCHSVHAFFDSTQAVMASAIKP